MRGHRPNRPTGTGKWAVFDQAVWDELFSGQNKWHDSPTIKVVESSIGRWLNAKLNPPKKLPGTPTWDAFIVAVHSPSWVTYANAQLTDGSNCSPGPGHIVAPGGDSTPDPWIDFNTQLAGARALLSSLDFDHPPIPWGDLATGYAPNPCVNLSSVTTGRVLIYCSKFVTPDPAHVYKIEPPDWFAWNVGIPSNAMIGLVDPVDSIATIFSTTCGGPQAYIAAVANNFGTGISPAGCVNPSWFDAIAGKIRIHSPGACVEDYQIKTTRTPLSCRFDSFNTQFEPPDGDPSFGKTAAGILGRAAWIWATNPDCTGAAPLSCAPPGPGGDTGAAGSTGEIGQAT